MEVEVSALMGEDDEEFWRQASLFVSDDELRLGNEGIRNGTNNEVLDLGTSMGFQHKVKEA
jgi:hypothetical protein